MTFPNSQVGHKGPQYVQVEEVCPRFRPSVGTLLGYSRFQLRLIDNLREIFLRESLLAFRIMPNFDESFHLEIQVVLGMEEG